MSTSPVPESTPEFLDIHHFLNNRVDAVLQLASRRPGGDPYPFRCSYEPEALTPQLLRGFREMEKASRRGATDEELRSDERLVDFLEAMLVSWEMPDKANPGQALGVSRSDIESVPIVVLMAIATAMTEQMNPLAKDDPNSPKAITRNGLSPASSRKSRSRTSTGGGSTGRSPN